MGRVLKHGGPKHTGYTSVHVHALLHGHLSWCGAFGTELPPLSEQLYSDETYAAAGKAWRVLRKRVMDRVTEWNTARGMTACLHPGAIVRPWGFYQYDGPHGDLAMYDGTDKAMIAAQDLYCTDEAEYLAKHCPGELTEAEWRVRAMPYTPPVVRGAAQ